ncbi:MAG: cell division protein FtsA [Synergistales bacterium]|nr:cell division protein FtsA [Synergistales bacterium]
MVTEPELLVGLDIGASKVVVVVAERDEQSGEALIIGVGQARSMGIRKGLIVNLEQAVRSVEQALDDARQMVGLPLDEATVAFGGSGVKSVTSRGMVSLGRVPRQITVEDIERVIEAAQTEVNVASNLCVLHTIPVEYSIDGNSGIDDPLGMTGVRLEIELQSLILSTAVVQNVITCIERAGIQVRGLIIKPLASALGVLTSEDVSVGAVIIDVGGGATSVAVYADGKPKRLSVIPVGGDHITNDLAAVLRIPIGKAEALKKEVSLDEAEESLSDILEFETRGKQCTCTVREVVDVITCRLEELFGTLVSKELQTAKIPLLPGGVILTGGVARMSGIEHLVSELLDMPARVAPPLDIQRMPPQRNGVEYSAAAGIIRYIVEKERNPFKYIEPPREDLGRSEYVDVSRTTRKKRKSVRSSSATKVSVGSLVDSLKKTLKELF